MKRSLNERDIQSQIIDWLKLKHYFFWRQNVGGMGGRYKGKDWFVRFGYRGMPDLFIVRPIWHVGFAGVGYQTAEIIGIEVKRADGEQSTVQREFQTEFEKAGGRYCLARSLEDVVRLLG